MASNSVAVTVAATGTSSPTVGSFGVQNDSNDFNGSLLEESSSLGAAGGDTSDSKDSQQQSQQQVQQQLKEDLPREWFYDDIDMNDNDSLEEPKSPADDEYDYDPRYGTKKRKKRKPGKKATYTPGESAGPGRKRSGAGRGRSTAASTANLGSVGVGDLSMSGMDSVDGMGSPDVNAANTTPTTATTKPRKPRATGGTRGRRRIKNADPSNTSLSANSEPPSFESAAAAVGALGDLSTIGDEHNADLRNYRKYL